jgi:type II secretory pathway pseudopilin PulG
MNLRARLSDEGGVTLVELIVVCAILATVIAGITQLFVSASHAELNASNRFQAQQQARLALDALRREIHCASGVSASGGFPASSITITLPAGCASNLTGATANVVWCTAHLNSSGAVATPYANRYGLYRYVNPSSPTCGVTSGYLKKADYLWATTSPAFSGAIFTSYFSAVSCLRAKLAVDLPVQVSGGGGSTGTYELTDDIVLRNTARTPTSPATTCYP